MTAALDPRIAGLFTAAAAEQLRELRRSIHANPELAFQETATADRLTAALGAFGIADVRRIGKTGIGARVRPCRVVPRRDGR